MKNIQRVYTLRASFIPFQKYSKADVDTEVLANESFLASVAALRAVFNSRLKARQRGDSKLAKVRCK